MLSPYNLFALMSQLPVVEAGQLLLVTGIAFVIITLIASTRRFHTMIQLNEEDLETVDDLNSFFFVQVTRYLSKINRISPGFGVVSIQFRSEETHLRPVQEDLLNLLNRLVREDCDKACLFREDCVAAIIDTEEERVTEAADRIVRELSEKLSDVSSITSFRAGVSQFPGSGLTSQAIIDAATEAMETASFSTTAQFSIAPLMEKPEEEPEDGEVGELTKKDESAAIDPLTGVLKPEAVGSYMLKYLADIRYKKNPASALCVGINKIDSIISLHGEGAADAVIAGVAGVIQKLTRDSDLIGRYQREEFLVLVPCSMQQGEQVAIRLREAVQKEAFLFEGRQLRTTISVGISAHPEHGRTLRDLFRGARTALAVIKEWKTSSCLVYDPAKHNPKGTHEPASKTWS